MTKAEDRKCWLQRTTNCKLYPRISLTNSYRALKHIFTEKRGCVLTF